MSDAGLQFSRRIIARQVLVGVSAFLVVALFAPRLLVLEEDVAGSVFAVATTLAVLAVATAIVTTIVALRRHLPLVRALAAGGQEVEPGALGLLAELPTALSVRFFIATSLVSSLVLAPGARPDRLDSGRAVSLFILAMTILAGAALPHYVLLRQAVFEVLERSPLEPLTVLIEALELRRLPARRIMLRLLVAVVAPVALICAGAVLVTHAHLRTLTEQGLRATSTLVARTALDRPSGAPEPPLGRDAAARAAEGMGFLVHVEPKSAESTDPLFTREPDGKLSMTVPIEEGQAVLQFDADLDPGALTGSVVVGVLAVLLAALLGALFGRVLASDLEQATRSVRLLGTESVLRGGTQIARPARFSLVGDLGRAIEELTARFRVFAEAQEKALDARAAAHRMRSLLFASVSHDLKSPLNAVLGFAELVGQGLLTEAQRESLELIQKRGRELLGLIETILDAARVEAGQLELTTRPAQVSRLVAEAVRKARELVGDSDAPALVQISPGLPTVPADPAYLARAVAVVVAHGLRTAAADAKAPVTRVRAVLSALPGRGGERVLIDVTYGAREVTRADLELLFARQATGRGRGLTLGLSLARSVIELHGGAVEVEGRPEGGVVCHVWLPLVAPTRRPQLTSFPTLG